MRQTDAFNEMPFPRNSFENSNAKAEKSVGEANEKQFSENSISFYYLMQLMPITHFNYSGHFFIRTRVKGQKWAEKSSRAELKSTPKPFTQNNDRMHFIADHNFHPQFFGCFREFSTPKIRFAKTKFDLKSEMFSTCERTKRRSGEGTIDIDNERRGKIAREWNNQHNRSF